ncbi:MAG: keto-deoxy-phosphogluconate aldolase [Gammaproteobacteria bacterium]|nr:MAG: keto-deoxy-phosphogluconate aldolase [Gammaproteobacteria bacterium]
MNVIDLMRKAPVIPVIVIDDPAHAEPLARAMVAGSLPVLEVTLRTPAALDAVRIMSAVDGAIVGVGTALDARDLERALAAGAEFAVSPGYTDALGKTAHELGMPLLPGSMTPADIMRARDGGYNELKFFPASQAGGIAMLKALGGPFVDVRFCPTGGVSLSTAPDFLALNNVECVGGSWVAPQQKMRDGDWTGIEALAREAAAL